MAIPALLVAGLSLRACWDRTPSSPAKSQAAEIPSTPADLVAGSPQPSATTAQIPEGPDPAAPPTPVAQLDEPPAPAPSPSIRSNTFADGPSLPSAPPARSRDVEPTNGGASGVEAPGVEAPGVDSPGVEAPSVDSPSVEAPGVEAPGVEAPGVEAPGVDSPGVDSLVHPTTERTAPVPAPTNAEPTAPLKILPPVPYETAQKIFAPQPPYPAAARQRGETGTVVVRGTVTPDGDVRHARVTGSVSPDLDRAALEAFRTWQFQPATRNKIPIESEYSIAFRFALDGASAMDEDAESSRGAIPTSAAGGTDEDPLPWQGPFVPPSRYYSPLPPYPQSAWATGTQGTVTLEVVVRTDGRVGAVEVLEGLPNGIDEAAVEAVKRWQFQPATRDGRAVAVYHRLTLKFAP